MAGFHCPSAPLRCNETKLKTRRTGVGADHQQQMTYGGEPVTDEDLQAERKRLDRAFAMSRRKQHQRKETYDDQTE